MFKVIKLKLDSYFEGILYRNNSFQIYSTRNKNIRLPLYSKSMCQNSAFYQGAVIWDSLPEKLKEI